MNSIRSTDPNLLGLRVAASLISQIKGIQRFMSCLFNYHLTGPQLRTNETDSLLLAVRETTIPGQLLSNWPELFKTIRIRFAFPRKFDIVGWLLDLEEPAAQRALHRNLSTKGMFLIFIKDI